MRRPFTYTDYRFKVDWLSCNNFVVGKVFNIIAF